MDILNIALVMILWNIKWMVYTEIAARLCEVNLKMYWSVIWQEIGK